MEPAKAELVSFLSVPVVLLLGACSRHERDVLDLAWSPDGNYLISGSVDNTAIVWDVARGEHAVCTGTQTLMLPVEHSHALPWGLYSDLSLLGARVRNPRLACMLNAHARLAWPCTLVHWSGAGCPEYFLQDHGHYVQGVGWDPLGAYLVTSSGDRTSRVYTVPFGAPPALQVARGSVSKPKGGKAAAAAAVRCVQVLHRREVSGDAAAASGGAPAEAAGPARAEGGGAQPMHAVGATPTPKVSFSHSKTASPPIPGWFPTAYDFCHWNSSAQRNAHSDALY